MRNRRLAAALTAAIILAPVAGAAASAGGQGNPDVPNPEPPQSITVTTDEPTPITIRDRSVPVTIPDWVGGNVEGGQPVPRDPDWIAEEVELVSDLMQEGAIDNWTEAEDYIQQLEDLLDEIAEEGNSPDEEAQNRRFSLWCYFSPTIWWYCMR